MPWKPANAVTRCEQSGGHVVSVPSWPPPRKPSDRENEKPSFTLQCQRCDGWVIVYDDKSGIRINKPVPESVSSKK